MAGPKIGRDMMAYRHIAGTNWGLSVCPASFSDPRVNCFTTQRYGGISQGNFAGLNCGWNSGDEQAHVAHHMQLLSAVCATPLVQIQQTHSTTVYDADQGLYDTSVTNYQSFLQAPCADAVVSCQTELALCIVTADCLPVALCSPQCIALAHAGWRGLANGILQRTIQAIRIKDPNSVIEAWIGPAISQAHYEVGLEVYHAFCDDQPALQIFFQAVDANHFLADLAGIASYLLQQETMVKVSRSGECTYAQPEHYYSWRRQHPTGRMATVICRYSGYNHAE